MTRAKHVGAALVAVVVGLSAFEPAVASASPEPVQTTPAEIKELSAILQSAINERNQQMLVGESLDSTDQMSLQRFSTKSKSKVAAEYSELKARKKRLAGYGQGYSGISTNFESEKFQVTGDRATAEVTERTELTYTTGGPPESYEYEQVVDFSRSGTGWVIDAIKPKSSEGILPSTVVSAEQLSYSKNPPGSNAALHIESGQKADPAKAEAANSHAPQVKVACTSEK